MNINEKDIKTGMSKRQKIIVGSVFGVLTIACIALLVFALNAQSDLEKANKKAATSQKVVNQAATILKSYVDTAGRNHVIISSDENKLAQDWYKNGTAISGGLIDTVAEALNIARKQLIEVTQIATTSQARALKAERGYDSLKRLTLFYRGKFLELAYRPPVNPKDSTDFGEFDYTYRDSLNVVQYWKKKWFLGAKKSYIDIYSNDPRTTVNGVKRLVVEQKEPRFGLRVQAVSNYSFSRKLINVGPGIQFDFNRWSLVGTYYYDLDAMQWRPSMGVRYDLVRF